MLFYIIKIEYFSLLFIVYCVLMIMTMFHSKASYSPMDKNNIKPHLDNINIREGVRTATIKDKKLRRKYFTSQIFNIIIILIIVIFQVKTIKTIQKLEEKNIDIERKLFAVETFINDTFVGPVEERRVLLTHLKYNPGAHTTFRGPLVQPADSAHRASEILVREAVSNFHKIYHNIN